MKRQRLLVALVAGLGCTAVGAGHAAGPPQDRSAVRAPAATPERALLNQYCVTCHNQRLKTAGLMLDTADVTKVAADTQTWEKVLRKVRGRVMPPPGQRRPDERTYEALVSYLETSLDAAAAARPNPGRSDTFRRLNRIEYRNAVRDLIAADVDVALLPSDDVSQGFDNVSLGALSPTVLERYLAVASKISRAAVGAPLSRPNTDTVGMVSADLTQEGHFDGLPLGTRGGTMAPYYFPLDGEYSIQVRMGRTKDDASVAALNEVHQLELTLDGERLQVFTLTPDPPSVRGGLSSGYNRNAVERIEAGLKFRVPVKAGLRVVGVTFLKKPSLLSDAPRSRFLGHTSAMRTQPFVQGLSITGPFDASGPGDTPSRRTIFVCRPGRPSQEAGCARTILATLARAAYRRPVTEADLQPLLRFYTEVREEGEDFERGVETALRALLVSPAFLFRIERDPASLAPNTPYRVSDLELASRLSFFLWSSLPDEALLTAAVRNELSTPATLTRHVRRMLADERSDVLVSNFVGQWLRLRNLGGLQPDPRAFPNFADDLRQAFRQETELFFASILREDRSVLDLLNADYTFANERLAKHYGMPNIYGSHFRRVNLEAGSPRRGLLGHGSLLMGTSYPDRTSPVSRGKWILENILGTPPPPPPENVPPLPDNPNVKGLSMRERMVQHRANPACAGCHQLMDPLGLALENFDAVGAWRTRQQGSDGELDVSGAMPDGTKYDGVVGLREALLSRPDLFLGTLTEKLLTYAVGRPLDPYADAPAIRAITRVARRDYRLSSLIVAIVNSAPFQMRITAPAAVHTQVATARPAVP